MQMRSVMLPSLGKIGWGSLPGSAPLVLYHKWDTGNIWRFVYWNTDKRADERYSAGNARTVHPLGEHVPLCARRWLCSAGIR